MRPITAEALALIKRNEGLRLNSYKDIAGITSIGYGHTPAYPGQTITESQATALLLSDIGHAADAVTAATAGVPTNDNQYSAMVSLAFNIGTGAFRGSSVLRMHRVGDHTAAANAFLMWDKAHVDGELVSVAGLHRRRVEEQTIYLAPVATAAPAIIPGPVIPDSAAIPKPAPVPTPPPRHARPYTMPASAPVDRPRYPPFAAPSPVPGGGSDSPDAAPDAEAERLTREANPTVKFPED